MPDLQSTGRQPPAGEVLDALNELFFVMNADGRLLQWNRQVNEMTGFADEEIAAMHLTDLVPADERRFVGEIMQRTRADGRSSERIHLLTRDDAPVLVEFKAALRPDGDQPLFYVRGRTIDETDLSARAGRPQVEQFQDVLSELPVYVFTQDRNLKYTWVSQTSLVDDPDLLIGKTDKDLLSAEDARRTERVKRRILQTGEAARVEFEVTLSSTERSYDAYLAPIRGEDGEIIGIAGASMDISARKEAEEDHVASERRYHELFEAARDGIAIHTPEGQILDINQAGLEILGYSREELEALDATDLFPYPEQAERGAKIMEKEGEVRNLEVRLHRKDGEEIVCLISSTAQTNEAGETEQYFTFFRDITERKQYQDQFRLLVEEVRDYAIFMLDEEGQIISWNEGAEKIKGYARDEILGEHYSTFFTAEDREAGRPEQMMERAVRKGRVEDENWRLRKDGSRFWVRATLTALRDEEGCLRGFAKVTRDLTEERRRKEALRESERRYRRLFEESQEGIGISTSDGKLIDVNPAGQEILGYSKEELQEMPLQELYVNPEERRRGRERLVERGAVRNLEVTVRRKDGEEIICQLSSTMRRGPDGEIEAFQTFFRDITAQKRAYQALEESEEKFRTVAEKALIGIGLVQDGVMKYVNPCYAEIFGYEEEELIGRSPEIFVHPDDWNYVQRQVQRRLAGTADSVRYQFKGVTKDGESRHLDVYGGQITYKGAPAVIATVMDITRQRRLEEQLLEIQEEERQRIGQELHDGIASQLTGVTMIGEGLTHNLAEGREVSPDDLKEMTDLVRETAHQTRLLSRGLNPVEVGKEGLPAALEKLAATTEKQSGLSCQWELEGEPPEVEGQMATHVYRIAQEAVSNAVKHAAADTIWLCLSTEQDALLLSVEDDGKGLSQKVREEAEGLGLHTMQYRADLIGGTLEITDRPDGGTLVRCRLPRL